MSGIFVLGHRGMLGHLLVACLQDAGFHVVTSEHRYTGAADDLLLDAVRESGCPWVINALGAIPQKEEDAQVLFRANTQFPLHLLHALRDGQRMIHASTDCVFAGTRGQYRTNDSTDAKDAYGLSKMLGEAVAMDPRVYCLRTSLIGPDLGSGWGLLAWFLQQQGTVNGFTNHRWNGVTTLEWARTAMEIIQGTTSLSPGVTQLGTAESVSKFELLSLIAEVWAVEKELRPTAAPQSINRTLVPDLVRPPLREQLLELRQWILSHHHDQPRQNQRRP
ncbi:sugar nucleotide-binding protein [Roseimicrobium gellanilyticum]|uniref:sugar nucleotide-binding protein n=1 Tax=Roseimicrobium gellanilyticum TaxID=748857 RepID=UPI0011BFE16D|nr:sugar nucleotide-binding protein [Roseimicrobium gellanilyticum]